MVHTLYINLSRSVNTKPIAGRGVALQVVGHTSSDVQCNYCKGFGHVTQDCVVLKREHRRVPNPGVSNISENSTCLATEKDGQETRGEGDIEISGTLSIRLLRIAMRTTAPSMLSAVQTLVTPTMPLTTSTTRSRSPQWKHRRTTKRFGHSALRTNQSTPTGCSDLSAALAEKRLMTRSSWSRKNRPSNWDSSHPAVRVALFGSNVSERLSSSREDFPFANGIFTSMMVSVLAHTTVARVARPNFLEVMFRARY